MEPSSKILYVDNPKFFFYHLQFIINLMVDLNILKWRLIFKFVVQRMSCDFQSGFEAQLVR